MEVQKLQKFALEVGKFALEVGQFALKDAKTCIGGAKICIGGWTICIEGAHIAHLLHEGSGLEDRGHRTRRAALALAQELVVLWLLLLVFPGLSCLKLACGERWTVSRMMMMTSGVKWIE